jgi:hypothetical protein
LFPVYFAFGDILVKNEKRENLVNEKSPTKSVEREGAEEEEEEEDSKFLLILRLKLKSMREPISLELTFYVLCSLNFIFFFTI